MKDWVFKGVIPLLAALLGIAFQAQSQASWGPWLKVATIIAGLIIVGYALWSLLRTAWLDRRGRRRDRRIESDFGHEVVAVASRVGEANNRNFTLSARCILNSLFDAKVCDSVMSTDSGQVKRVGTTRPAPLPDRVGANAMMCSGPSCRRYRRPVGVSRRPRKGPAGWVRPAAVACFGVAHFADP